MQANVIKRSGKRPTESFDQSKLHASIVAACLSVRSVEGEAETVAREVSRHVIEWLEQKTEVTSEDIRRKASEALHILHPEAAYLYKHHQVVL